MLQYVLRFVAGKDQGREFPLPQDLYIVIGRVSDVDILLLDEKVSRKHAKISTHGGKVVIEDLARSLGIRRVHVIEPHFGTDEFDRLLTDCLESNALAVIIARRPCILIAKQLKQYEERQCECSAATAPAS